MSEPEWVIDEQTDLLNESSAMRVRHALSAPGALLFGWHHAFASGASRSPVVMRVFEEFESLITDLRPGDHVTLYDLDAVRSLSVFHGSDQSGSSLVSQMKTVLRPVLKDPHSEVAVVGRSRRSGQALALMRELNEPTDEDWEPIESWYTEHDGDVYVFNTTIGGADNYLDRDGNGQPIASVNPSGRRRVNALVDATVPNQEGKVPRSRLY